MCAGWPARTSRMLIRTLAAVARPSNQASRDGKTKVGVLDYNFLDASARGGSGWSCAQASFMVNPSHFLGVFVRRSYFFPLFAAAGLLAVSSVSAQPRSVDAREFDVAGVKTGMGLDAVRQVMARHFNIAADAVKSDPYPSVNPVTGTKLPSYLVYEAGNEKLLVHFEPRVPVNAADPLAVSQIIYEIPWTQSNEAAMAQRAVTRYGEPSNAPNSMKQEWCESPSDNPGMGCSMRQQAVLSVSGTKLQLHDPAWSQARIEFLRNQQSASPGF